MTEHSTKINLRPSSVLNTFVKRTPGIKFSKCVYLAFMGVKIEYTVGGQNQFSFQNAYLLIIPTKTLTTTKEKIVCTSELNGIHGNLNKIVFCWKFCHICHLRRLPAIIIVLSQRGDPLHLQQRKPGHSSP